MGETKPTLQTLRRQVYRQMTHLERAGHARRIRLGPQACRELVEKVRLWYADTQRQALEVQAVP